MVKKNTLAFLEPFCTKAEEGGKRQSFVSPAPHDKSLLQAVVIAGTDLILVQQLVGHLISHHGQTAGIQVEDDCTCKAVELLSPCTSSNTHQHPVVAYSCVFFFFEVTCAHGPPELQQTLEGEI